MKRIKLGSRARKVFRGSSRGFTLAEIVIAIGLLGIISVAVMTSLSYATTVFIIADRRATAESLAKSQMEYVKNSKYIDYSEVLSDREPDFYGQITIPGDMAYYTLETTVEPINPSTRQPYPVESPGVYVQDDGIQRIMVTVTYYVIRFDVTSQNSTQIEQSLTLEDYKRDPEITRRV